MTDSKWLKQSKDNPLFSDLLWSRPETKSRSGRLLIVGGHAQGFRAPATAYAQAVKARVGVIKVLLPDSLRATVGKNLEDAVYCPSNQSGSFSRESLAELLDHSSWADLTLLAGDFGHNSETAILLESFIDKHPGPLCLSGDGLSPFLTNPLAIFDRPETLIVSDLSQLQKLVTNAHVPQAIASSFGLVQLVEVLNELTRTHQAVVISSHLNNIVVSVNGKTSATSFESEPTDWALTLAAYSSVWWLQNATKPFEAMTTAVYDRLYGTPT